MSYNINLNLVQVNGVALPVHGVDNSVKLNGGFKSDSVVTYNGGIAKSNTPSVTMLEVEVVKGNAIYSGLYNPATISTSIVNLILSGTQVNLRVYDPSGSGSAQGMAELLESPDVAGNVNALIMLKFVILSPSFVNGLNNLKF